ncbi:MAG TPA: YqeG family HAD IIIA-type phosphatase [Clostridia bacterium]|nr:YqeG family HAD IIIA-type phosphatase [Clostridia bacterium]
MLNLLKPDLYVNQLQDVPLPELIHAGIRGIIIDLDNTITAWNSPEVTGDIFNWFQEMKQHQFQVCLVSNNGKARVAVVADKLGIPFIFKASKPRRRSFRQAMEVLGTKPPETAVIGDQVFTDVLGGNRLNLYTILVVPLNKREFIGTRFMRQLENIVIKTVVKKKMGESDA